MPQLTTKTREIFERRLHRAAGGAGVTAVAIGAFYLGGWLCGIMTYPAFKTVPMTTNGSLCLMLSGLALLLSLPRHHRRTTLIAARALAAVVIIIGALTVMEDVTAWDLGIDHFLARKQADVLPLNRLNLPGSVGFILAAAATLLITGERLAVLRLSQVLAFILCLDGLSGMVGYLYGAMAKGVDLYTAATLPTNVGFLLLGAGILFARPGEALVASLVSPDPGGVTIRHLLVPAVLVPIILGWLILRGEVHRLYGLYFGTSLLVTGCIALLSCLIYLTGRKLSRSSRAEEAATEALKASEKLLRQANDELEERVRERTSELSQALQELERESEERIRAVEDLRNKEELLTHQSRLAAMGEMIGNIAHQWRQPLNILGLLVQDLRMSYNAGELDGEYLDTAVSKSMALLAHMSTTIDDFRNFFKPDEGIACFKIGDVINASVSLMEAGLKQQGVRLDVDEQEELWVDGYRNQFAQVIVNLLMNARDVLKERSVQQPQIRIRIFRNHDGKTAVTVTDNGGGVPVGVMQRIFDPYFTTKGPDKGTGVGLFMAKTIIEQHMNGSLSVRNTPEGAEFTIVL